MDIKNLSAAFGAILKLRESENDSQTSDMLDDAGSETLSVVFRFAKYPPAWSNPKLLSLTHPLYDERTEACLICKPPQRKWKEILAKQNIQTIKKVIDSDKLRRKFRESKDRMELQRSFGIFFVDRRLLDCIPQFLGKDFRSRKKDPIAITLKEESLAQNVQEALSGTYLLMRQGRAAAVKIGRCDMSPSQLAENARTVIDQVSKFVKEDQVFQNRIDCIGIKATSAAEALPVYYGEEFQSKVYNELLVVPENSKEGECNDDNEGHSEEEG